MATARLLRKAFDGRHLFWRGQIALPEKGPARYWEPVHFQTFNLWFLQRRRVLIPAQSHVRQMVIHGDRWREELKSLNKSVRDHLRLDVVRPPEVKIYAEKSKKLPRLVEIDFLIKRFRRLPQACISRKQLLKICVESAGEEDAKGVVKSLDESGQVFIVGDCVYLRPQQVASVMENILPLLDAPRREQLDEMEKQKAEIDMEAKKIVRRELWSGLGFMILQTTYLMQLTFWELSWDVMEPVCFLLTSTYFLAGYAFFLRTSTDPTFESFFQARFKTKQKRLMKKNNFDIARFKELQTVRSLTQPACI